MQSTALITSYNNYLSQYQKLQTFSKMIAISLIYPVAPLVLEITFAISHTGKCNVFNTL